MGDGVWGLWRGDELLGEIAVTGQDFPWLHGKFAATAAFAEVKPLFDRDNELSDENVELSDENIDEANAICQVMRTTLRMTSPEGPVAEFWLRIDGEDAGFRWHHERFAD
jgi:hypothetical protein